MPLKSLSSLLQNEQNTWMHTQYYVYKQGLHSLLQIVNVGKHNH